LPTAIRFTPGQRRRLFAAMKRDKKVNAGQITFVLAERIGKVRFGEKIPVETIKAALDGVTNEYAG
jgi:3-dehydroquinate synthetase